MSFISNLEIDNTFIFPIIGSVTRVSNIQTKYA